MQLRKMGRRLIGLSIFAVMGVSLFSAGANAPAVKAAEVNAAEVKAVEANAPAIKVAEAKASASEVAIDETNFPDITFREYVKGYDTDGNGSFSSDEIQNVRIMYAWNKGIASLKGIEYFTALEELSCNGNELTSLDLSKNEKLVELFCEHNHLTSLIVSKNTALSLLTCNDNQLTNLDLSKNTALTSLSCYNNRLTSLDVSGNEKLDYLSCFNNRLTSLDLSKNTALKNLICYDNQLTNLDLSKNADLCRLECGGNQLTSLDLSKNPTLYMLKCEGNQLTSLDLSKNEKIFMLYCGNNQLASLDLSKNTGNIEFACQGNAHPIVLSAGNTFDMSTISGMDVSKVSNITGGTLNGKILTMNSGAKEASYTYDCGNENTAEFKLVVKESFSPAKVTLSKTSYIYTGSAFTPAVTVTYGGKKLAYGTDYTVTYSNNKVVGTATVTITGKGDYLGTIKKTFRILPSSTTVGNLTNRTKGITIKWKKLPEAGGYVIYRSKNGGNFRRIKTITSGKTGSYTDKYSKTNGAKYQYKIVSYKKVGKATYKSAYSKTKTIYRMSAPKIKELTNKSGKKVAVKWTKNKKATGYQIQYATNSKFKKAKTVTVKKAKAVSTVITKLKKNSTYRVRVRAYKKVSGRKYYSDWSSTKSVKVRK